MSSSPTSAKEASGRQQAQVISEPYRWRAENLKLRVTIMALRQQVLDYEQRLADAELRGEKAAFEQELQDVYGRFPGDFDWDELCFKFRMDEP